MKVKSGEEWMCEEPGTGDESSRKCQNTLPQGTISDPRAELKRTSATTLQRRTFGWRRFTCADSSLLSPQARADEHTSPGQHRFRPFPCSESVQGAVCAPGWPASVHCLGAPSSCRSTSSPGLAPGRYAWICPCCQVGGRAPCVSVQEQRKVVEAAQGPQRRGSQLEGPANSTERPDTHCRWVTAQEQRKVAEAAQGPQRQGRQTTEREAARCSWVAGVLPPRES